MLATFDFSNLSPSLDSQGNNVSSRDQLLWNVIISTVNSLPDFHVVFYIVCIFWIIPVNMKVSDNVNFSQLPCRNLLLCSFMDYPRKCVGIHYGKLPSRLSYRRLIHSSHFASVYSTSDLTNALYSGEVRCPRVGNFQTGSPTNLSLYVSGFLCVEEPGWLGSGPECCWNFVGDCAGTWYVSPWTGSRYCSLPLFLDLNCLLERLLCFSLYLSEAGSPERSVKQWGRPTIFLRSPNRKDSSQFCFSLLGTEYSTVPPVAPRLCHGWYPDILFVAFTDSIFETYGVANVCTLIQLMMMITMIMRRSVNIV